ncbi:hypothetical protein [Chelativorans oligotrophicus]|uniref:hypothetical protein n=1 Tax=Chelativorans oligotrophicus TaxID=449974 RepID=UPI001407CEA7|nr:hypothetical protein [Chelativorans oligotrophicus]
MTDQTDQTQPATEQKKGGKASAKQTTANAAGKQKFTEKELKDIGLDPACYGYTKK